MPTSYPATFKVVAGRGVGWTRAEDLLLAKNHKMVGWDFCTLQLSDEPFGDEFS